METTRTSYIEHQLSQVKASSTSTDAFMSFLTSLKSVILDLIDHPFDGKYNIVSQISKGFAVELLSTYEAREFIKFLGYNEDGDQFVYITSDENMSKLEDCLQILENQLHKQHDVVLCEVNGDNIQRKANRLEGKQQKEEVQQGKLKAARCASGLKEFFLSKHMKKEHCDSPVLRKKNNMRSPDFAFNTSGYFHQSCNNKANRDSRNTKQSKRCFIRDLFHKQDHHIKGWSSPGCDVKLI